jgi:hypothetical protein
MADHCILRPWQRRPDARRTRRSEEFMIEDPAPTDSVIGACEAAIREGQPKVAPPGTLYHLTDVDGLSGIAGNKCLWASLATTLNDCQEIRYGVALAEEVIEKRLLGRRDEYHSSLLTYVRPPPPRTERGAVRVLRVHRSFLMPMFPHLNDGEAGFRHPSARHRSRCPLASGRQAGLLARRAENRTGMY